MSNGNGWDQATTDVLTLSLEGALARGATGSGPSGSALCVQVNVAGWEATKFFQYVSLFQRVTGSDYLVFLSLRQ